MRTFGMALGTLFFLIALSACGGSDPGSPSTNAALGDQATQPPEPDATVSTNAMASTASASAIDVSDGSPLEQLVGAPINDDEAMNRFYEQLESEAEAATAECMLQQGFQYTPWTRRISPLEASGLQEDSVEFATQFGFGIVSDFSFYDLDVQNDEGGQDEYLSTLTDGERDAYDTALFGSQSDEDNDGDQWGGGCYGDSYEAAYAKSPDRIFDLLEEEAMSVIQQYFADPRILETEKAYAECMSTNGYAFENPEKAKIEIAREMSVIVSDEANFADPRPLEEQGEFEMGWNDESIMFRIAGDTLTDDGQTLLDALGQKELATALVSAECFAPLRKIQLEVQFEYEQIIVDQIGDQARAILAEE